MAEPDTIILVYLPRIDEKVDRLIGNVNGRMSVVEEDLAGVHRRIDSLEFRAKRRLDLADVAH